jgi:prepilin-type N-terminal cleavage/methylation domain-containing protein
MFFQKKKNQKGFTLIELLVTISIFVILTGVVLFNQSKFNSTILLTNLAYDTALTIREAQTYGINVKGFGDSGGGESFVPYGVHFDKTEDNNKSFILFADLSYDKATPDVVNNFNGDIGTCDPDDGCVSRYNIQRGARISDLEVDDVSVDTLDIIFKRPDPDAIFYSGGENNTGGVAIIHLTSADGSGSTTIRVQLNGLIQIQ